MINVLVNGCNGRMGQTVVNQVKESGKFEVIAGFDRMENEKTGFPVYTNIKDIKEIPNVIIDFSVPEATFQMLEFAKEKKIPIVIATTGFSDDQIAMLKESGNEIPVFRSSNMSYEVNIMAKMVAELAKQLYDSDIEIVDVHHNNKVDSPSGTATILADSINEALGNTMHYEYNRHDKRQKRDKKEIGIHSIRGGTEVGKHTVMFLGDNESLEITHNVNSRLIFANGALKAAEFLITKSKGFYDMNDIV